MKNFTPKLVLLAAFYYMVFGYPAVYAQMSNPLETDPSVWNSKELIIIWGQAEPENQQVEVKQAIYGVDYIEYLEEGSSPFALRVADQTIPNNIFKPGVRPMAVLAGDYNNNGKDELVYAVAEENKIKIAAPPMSVIQNEDSTFSIQLGAPSSFLEIPTGVNAAYTMGRGIPVLAKGDLDGDGADEFVLAARNASGNLMVQVIDTDGGNALQLRGANQNETTVLDQYGMEVFDICTGDFNGDGKKEIAVAYLKNNPAGAGQYSVYLRIFEVAEQGSSSVIPKAGYVVDDQSILPYFDGETNISSVKLGIQSINQGANNVDDLVVSFAFTPYNQGNNQSNLHVKLLNVAPDLMNVSEVSSLSENVNFESFQSMKIHSGDLTGKSKQNAVVMVGNEFRVYDVAADEIELKAVANEADYQSDDPQYGNNNFFVSDIDKNGRENMLYVHTRKDYPNFGNRTLYIKSIELNTDYSLGTVIEKEIVQAEDYGLSQFYFGLAAGNFDGDDLRLGEPVVYECIYRRPLFILAPPPIHFDHLDGVNYDDSGCFLGGDCLFSASNTTTQSASTSLTVEQKNDWSVSSTVSAGFDLLQVSVGASMTAKYGEQFSKADMSTSDSTVTIQHTVTIDDFIKGVQYPVKVYEYPVYNANGDLINYVSAAFPQYQDLIEYQEQGKLDPYYIPYYEPGNLLSYPPISDISGFTNYDLDNDAFIYSGSNYTVNSNQGSSSSVDITAIEVYGSTGTRAWEGGAAMGLSANGFGMGVEANGTYNEGGMRVNALAMSGTESFRIQYDHITGGPSGFKTYEVKPYLFKTSEGTGMLAYQVNLKSSNTTPTWWDINYGNRPDPALMLPTRNEMYWTSGADPDSPIFTRSKSMTFNRLYPNVGDEVTVECRIHNYSLKATSGPVKVSFYNGNPDLGGEIVQSLDGETIFETSQPIDPQGMQVVTMTFAMPLPVIPNESFVRFYAVIDPLHEIEEIHEGNNIGWQVLGYDCENQSGTTNVYDYYSREQFTEMWVWPNPASTQVNLAFNMSSAHRAYVEIFDSHGKQIFMQNIGMLPAGHQEVNLDLPKLSSGIYFIQLNSNHFRKTKKLMIR